MRKLWLKTISAVSIIVATATAANASVLITNIGANPGQINGTITSPLVNGGMPMSADIGRFEMSGTMQPGGAPATFLSYCIDITKTLSTGTFNIVSLSSVFSNPIKAAQLTALVTSKDALITGTTQGDKNISAAIQLAVWEIINETASTYSLTAGSFQATLTDASAFSLAQGYLSNLGSTMAVPNRQLQVLYSQTNQSQIYVSGVPEPATWAMMIAGFGMIGAGMRSRRRTTSVVAAC